MSFLLFPHSIDSATITYSGTHDSGYGEEMLNDRNKNFLFKDTSPGTDSVSISIDLGSGVTRKADYLIIGNYKLSTTNGPEYIVEYSDNGSDYSTADTDVISEATSYSNFLIEFTKTDDYHRYWKLTLYDDGEENLTNIEIGNIFFGEKATLSTSFELNAPERRGWKAVQNEGAGGYRFSQIANTTTRRSWAYEFGYLTAAEKTALENVSAQIYVTEGLTHYPLYFSPDSGTTLYFARLAGQLVINVLAYEAYQTNLNFEQEI